MECGVKYDNINTAAVWQKVYLLFPNVSLISIPYNYYVILIMIVTTYATYTGYKSTSIKRKRDGDEDYEGCAQDSKVAKIMDVDGLKRFKNRAQ